MYDAVVRRIVLGHYRPGVRIRESDLRDEFGTSNGPVREALQFATADGLVERSPFRGVRVINLTPTEIREVFEVRRILLGAAAELAARRAPADIADRASAFKARFRAGLSDRGLGADPGDLSHWVFSIAGNTCLAEAYRRPLLQSLVYVNAILERHAGQLSDLDELVLALVDAVAARDPAAARCAADALTDETLRHLNVSDARPMLRRGR